MKRKIKLNEQMEDEIKQFLDEISNWLMVSKKTITNKRLNFTPEMFILWKIMKAVEK
jgi:hypothetical protein